ncbi:MAG: hypothetical protein H7835_20800 [Magnetococcus sp. XQGC-1]
MKIVFSLLLLLSLFTLTGCHGHHHRVVSHHSPPAKQWRHDHGHGHGYAAREPRHYRRW